MIKIQLGRLQRLGLAVALIIVLALIALLLRPTTTDPIVAMQSGDYRLAAHLLHNQLGDGNTLVSTTLGNLYYLGLGVEQDFNKSASLFATAAFAGNIAAQMNLGYQYYYGLGLPQDIQLAFAWFNFANDNGNSLAGKYVNEIMAEQKLSPQLAHQLRAQYATINNFPQP